MSAIPRPGATVPGQPEPTKVGVPQIGVSALTGAVPGLQAAVYCVPVCGPEVIVPSSRLSMT